MAWGTKNPHAEVMGNDCTMMGVANLRRFLGSFRIDKPVLGSCYVKTTIPYQDLVNVIIFHVPGKELNPTTCCFISYLHHVPDA